jgi:hypothetical protein
MLVKFCGTDPKEDEKRYISAAGTDMRRYTRLSNRFSRKIENHAAAVALTISRTTSSGFIVRYA